MKSSKVLIAVLGSALLISLAQIIGSWPNTTAVLMNLTAAVGSLSYKTNAVTQQQFTSRATPCSVQPVEFLAAQNWLLSQSTEDQQLLEYFNGLCGGTYIEMGALDGLRYSNSFVFNKAFDWKGLMVELTPPSFKKLQVNRPNELALVNAAVCSDRQTLHYHEHPFNGAVSGVWEFATPSFRTRYWPTVKVEDLVEIQCQPLQDIIDQHVTVEYFDFLSLDIEGAELSALKSVEWTRVGFGIIVVEADEHNVRKNLALRTFVESKGYVFLKDYNRSYWFANKNFASIYEKVMHASPVA